METGPYEHQEEEEDFPNEENPSLPKKRRILASDKQLERLVQMVDDNPAFVNNKSLMRGETVVEPQQQKKRVPLRRRRRIPPSVAQEIVEECRNLKQIHQDKLDSIVMTRTELQGISSSLDKLVHSSEQQASALNTIAKALVQIAEKVCPETATE